MKWNKRKHDQQRDKLDQAFLKNISAREAEQIKAQLSALWEQLKKKLRRKARTQDYILRELEEFRALIKGVKCDAIEGWLKMTRQMLDEKIDQLLVAQIAGTNEIKEHVPEGSSQVPRVARFKTREEFEAIPWIKDVIIHEAFAGFLRKFPALFVVAVTGEVFPVGSIGSEVGLTQYPTMEEYEAELGKAREEADRMLLSQPGTPDKPSHPDPRKNGSGAKPPKIDPPDPPSHALRTQAPEPERPSPGNTGGGSGEAETSSPSTIPPQ